MPGFVERAVPGRQHVLCRSKHCVEGERVGCRQHACYVKLVARRCFNDFPQDLERDAVHLLVSASEVGVQEMLHS